VNRVLDSIAPSLHLREPVVAPSLTALHEEALLGIFSTLPAATLAKLAETEKLFGPNGLLYGKIVKARGLAFGESLRFAHVLEAQPLSSIDWVVTGDDGWCTELGAVYVRPCRCRWGAEILKLDGLLAIGVAGQSFPTNSFVGASSSNVRSYGWEIRRRGAEKLVAVSSGGHFCETAQVEVDLLPREGRRVVLMFHLNVDRAMLELYAHIQERPASPWRWSLLSSMRFGGWPEAWPLRPLDRASFDSMKPAVSTDIGASVRVFTDDGHF